MHVRPCKFFSAFLVRVWHETPCGRAEKTNKAQEINIASFTSCSAAWSVKALKRGSLSEKLFCKKKKGLSFWERLPHLYEKRPINVELGAVNGPLGDQVKPLHTSFPVFQHGRGLLNETWDMQKICQKRVCYLASAWTIPQASSQRPCAIWHPSHPTILSAFSYSWLKKKTVRLQRNALLSSSIKTVKRRPVIPSTPVGLFSLSSPFFFWELCLFAHLGALKMLLDYALPEVKPQTYRGSACTGRSSSGGDGTSTGVDTQTLWWDSTQQIGKPPYYFFFFSVIGENQCGCITRNTERNLHGLNAQNMFFSDFYKHVAHGRPHLFTKWRSAGLTGQLHADAGCSSSDPISGVYFRPAMIRNLGFFV